MKIIDTVKKPEKAYDIDFEKEESKIFFDLCNAIYRNCDIRSIVNAYFKNTDSLYNQLDEKWHNTITHNILVGRTIKGVFIRSLNSFKLSDYIASSEGFSYRINNSGNFMKYSYDKFLKLSKIAVSLLFAKYQEVYLSEIRITIIKVLFNYFSSYNVYVDQYGEHTEWAYKADDIQSVLDVILNTDAQDICKFIKNVIGVENPVIVSTQNPIKINTHYPKPKCKEDITRFIVPGMTQNEIVQIVMENFGVKERTARTYLKENGLTRPYRTKEVEEICEVVEECSTDIKETINTNINLSTYTINENLSNIKNVINAIYSNTKDTNKDNNQQFVQINQQLSKMWKVIEDIQNQIGKQEMINHDIIYKASCYDEEHKEVMRLRMILESNYIKY